LLRSTNEQLARLPKAELHVHLDGSLRPGTLIDLAAERNVALPTSDPDELAAHMLVTDATSLEDYLAPFATTLRVMQDREGLERVSYELAEDHAVENVWYVEVRFCPLLCTAGGLSSDEVLDAVLAGQRRAEQATAIHCAVIVCGLRTLPPETSREMAELAVSYRGRGVCAFDLAGAEAGHPVKDHLEACRIARRGGLPLTIHAGEGYGPQSIQQALELAHAGRIGHGTRLTEDADLMARVRDLGVTLEICLTSNVQTRVAASYESHPLRRYFDFGIRACLCADNRLMSGVTLTEEYEHARDAQGFTPEELVRLARTGFESAYAPEDVKGELLRLFDSEVAQLR